MTINEALDYIHAVDWRRSSLGLSRIDELLAQMGHPERTMKFVHVTGTNGKGSTCNNGSKQTERTALPKQDGSSL